MKMNYLTDDELEQLIADVEVNDLIAAPPGLYEEILTRVEDISKEETLHIEKTVPITRNKKREYRRYCFQVITSMAAAIAIVFLLPVMRENQNLEVPKGQKIFGASVYETKQEALEDTGLLMEAFGGFNIFKETDQFRIFKR